MPATSANLGPGFDALGIALGLYAHFEVEASGSLFIEGAEPGHEGPDSLFFQAFSRGIEAMGLPPRGLHVRFKSDIPIARGLGSSAACIAGGLLAASAIGGAEAGSVLGRERTLQLTAEIEGHPDNTTPAILGGFAVSAGVGADLRYFRAPLGEELRFFALVPPFPLATATARAALPVTVPFRDAAFNAGHAALTTAAFIGRDWGLLDQACRDRLHEPYRAPLIAGFEEAAAGARGAGALAVFLSGAGPTLMAIGRTDETSLARRLTAVCAALKPSPWRLLALPADDEGAAIVE